ncbi:uncharacterized protein DUF1801 [Diaminobutyricimonas aerilata]|uniref:Uncharacterized protein DUF1801 n=1 Tax=Diaminobutyricimonas aerilata TaxID=1162967 RepID=A0A2M9CNN6_9MICO|nr:DUF1801 domain-containing protein [Diaminobutyricimonas aerilata]PJJ73506.1 uncharacterized protein DUF1801 [Diaminobutyricimonas aerilata]
MNGSDAPGEVDAYIDALPERRREDARVLRRLMERATGHPATLWGTMIGFGHVHYRYESGREGDTFAVGFAPRASAITVYNIHNAYDEGSGAALADLGPHTTGKSCIYLKRLDGIDLDVLERLVREAAAKAG